MLQEQTKKLLGTDIEITIISENDESLIFAKCFEIFQAVQDEFSRFDPNSSLSRLNRERSGYISPRFQDLGKKSQDMFRMTKGYFNPLCDISTLGYSASFEKKSVFKKHLKKSGYNLDIASIDFSQEIITLQDHQSLDFGGIAKGYAVDLVVDFLTLQGYEDFCVDAGGDMFLKGKNESYKPWCIGIEHPFASEDIVGTLELENAAIATSGSYKRNWEIDGEHYHHILNPLTGENETRLVSVTLIGVKNYFVDALATAIFCMPLKEALELIESQKIGAILVDANGKLYHNTLAQEKYNFS